MDRLKQNIKEVLVQNIRDELEQSIIEKVMGQLMLSFSQMHPQEILPFVEPKVFSSGAHVNIKGSCVNPSGEDPDTAT